MIYYLFIYILSMLSLTFSNEEVTEKLMQDIAITLSCFFPRNPRKDISNWRYKGRDFHIYYLSTDYIKNHNHYSLVHTDEENSLIYKLNFAYDMNKYIIIETSYNVSKIEKTESWCRIL